MGQYIVAVTSLPAALEVFSASHVKVKRMFPFVSAIGVEADRRDLAMLSRLKFVESVHADCLVRITSEEKAESFTPEKSELMRRLSDKKDEIITVAVIDTGVDEHPDLALFPNRIVAFADMVGGKTTPYDDNGHGTAVAGIICGSNLMRGGYLSRGAKSIRIAAVKALKSTGEGTAFDILSAMQWVYENAERYNIRVVNMSFGSAPQKGRDPLVLGANALVESGMTVVASAGNGAEEGEGVLSPGISPYVLTVGGSFGGREAAFSPHGGGKPDVLAEAVNVPTISNNGTYIALSGTSMAAPKISARCAELLSRYPMYGPDRVKSVIVSSAPEGI